MDLTQEKQRSYFGLKVNVTTLSEKGWEVQQIIDALGIAEKEYVIGLDSQLAKEQQPHYHIHWTDNRSLEALQKAKQRALPNWGRTTKLYAAKIKPHGDVYAWYGYAVKEKVIHIASSIDKENLMQHAHTQKEFKKSQLNYAADKAEKDSKKLSLEELVFEKITKYFSEECYQEIEFINTATEISRQWFVETGNPCRRQQLEQLTYKYLLSKGYMTHQEYIARIFRNY